MGKRKKIPSLNLQRSILNYIRENGPISRKQLSEIFNVSQAIITKITNYLIKKNLIYEKGEGKSSKKGGRKPIYLEINSEKGYLMAIDVGSYQIKGVISNLNEEILKKEIEKTDEKDILNQIIEFSKKLTDGYKEKLIGVCIGLPGVVDIERGISIFSANLPQINGINFSNIFKKEYKVPVKVVNSSIINVIGEYKEKERILNLYWGNGISVTFLSSGKEILSGKEKSRVDFGHITYEKNGRLCRCGKKGCLESYVGGFAIIDEIKKIIGKEISMEEALKLAEKNNEIRKIFEEKAYLVGKFLSFPVQYFSPEEIIFSGGLILNGGEFLIENIKKGLYDSIDESDYKKLRFRISKDIYTGCKGGIKLLIEELFNTHFVSLIQL
jgi:predicted NBD/HSP70 family sugar kinase